MNYRTHATLVRIAALLVVSSASLTLQAQSAALPVKPGLWEMSVTSTNVMSLPPEAEARIAAMPPAQQDQVRAMMSGAMGGGKPIVTARQVCLSPQTSIDNLVKQTQQSSGMQCTLSNQMKTAHGASFDMSCTGAAGTAQGHTEFRMVDDEHISGSNKMTVTGSSHGSTVSSNISSTTSGKYMSADCGSVRPMGSTPAAQ